MMTNEPLDLRQAILKADKTVVEAMQEYLRTSRKGGMPKGLADKIEAAVADAARLCYFSVAIADTCQGG